MEQDDDHHLLPLGNIAEGGNKNDNVSDKEEELRSSPKNQDRELQKGDSRMSIDNEINEIVSIYLFTYLFYHYNQIILNYFLH
jgi:hypothetical protein